MTTWYRTQKYNDAIDPVEVVRATRHTLFLPRDQRTPIMSEWYRHFRSMEEARMYLIGRCLSAIDDAKREIQKQEQRMEALQGNGPG